MNILIWYWGRKGGGAKHAYELTKALKDQSDVNVFVSICKECELYDSFMELDLINFSVSIFPNKVKLVFNMLKMPYVKRKFTEFMKENKIDIVLCPMGHILDEYMYSSIKNANVKYIYTINDALNHPGEVQRGYYARMMKQIDRADKILALSAHVKEELYRQYGLQSDKCWVVPLGVFSYNKGAKVRKLDRSKPINILFFGRIVEYKGLGMAIRAFKLLKQYGYNVQMEVSGNGNMEPYQELLSDAKGITVHNEWIQESDIEAIFNRADIVINSYIEASQSGVVAIAIDMGVPTVATPVGGLKEQIEQTGAGVVCSGVSDESIARAIAELIDDDNRYHTISKKCIELAANEFSWDARAKQLIDLINTELI